MPRSPKKNGSKPTTAKPSDPWSRKTITVSLSAERRALLRSVLPEDQHGLLSPADVIYHLIDLLDSDDPEQNFPAPQNMADDRLERLELATQQNAEALALCAESLKQVALSMEPLQRLISGQGPAALKPASSWIARVVAILRPAPHSDIKLGLKLVSMVPNDAGTVSISFDVVRLDGPAVSLPPLRLKPMAANSPLSVCLRGRPLPTLELACKKEATGWRATIRKSHPHASDPNLLELML
jgi:hypothetical protein